MSIRLAAASLLLVAAGCGSHASVLDEGVRLGRSGVVHRYDADEAAQAVRSARAQWEHELQTRARAYPRQTFLNLARPVLRERLDALSRRYGFDVTSVKIRRPRQDAPDIVVRTTKYLALAEATPAILTRLDPKLRTNDDRTGWRYEGFFFEADDEHGVPFLAVFNFWRGPGGGGGDWARSDRLFPFPHG